MKKNSASPKIYKFALYGRAASGKTCILAALAMKRTAHQQGYTCTWLPAPEASGKNKKDDIEAFAQGREWLREAINNLSSHSLPAPNPNRNAPLRYLYRFGTPDAPPFLVELIDYSGELIDPDITHNELAQKLHARLTEMDGILLLAEAPLPERDMEPLSDEMLKLEQAFMTLQEKKSHQHGHIPVALLINKWDRRFSENNPLTPESSKRHLQDFLAQDPEPPHLALVNVLKNALPPELFQIFPVSAFGAHKLTKTESGALQEVPREVKPLRSFGLEDGFIWLAHQKDLLELESLSQTATHLAPFKFWQFFMPWRAKLKQDSKKLAKRFLPQSQAWKQLGVLRRKTQKTAFCQLLTTLGLVLFLLLSAEALYDTFNYKNICLRLENPLTPQQEIKKDEKWLEAYYVSPPYRHVFSKFFILGKDEAQKTVSKNRQAQEERFWQEIQQSQEQALRNDLAKRYLALFPNGAHTEAAARIQEQTRFLLLGLENKKFLEKMERRIRQIQAKEILSQREIDALREQFVLPRPQAMSSKLIAKELFLRRELGKIQIRLAKTQGSARWFRFREQYMELMRLGDIMAAALLLQKWPARTEDFFALKKDFETRSLTALENRVRQLQRNRQWHEAKALIKKTTDDSRLLRVCSEEQKKGLNALMQSVLRSEDKFLYEQLRQQRNQQSAAAYLQKAPLQTMRPEVLAWNTYLLKTRQKTDLQLVAKELVWGDLPFTYNNEYNDITITLNGQDILYIPRVKARRFTTTRDLGSVRIRAGLHEHITLGVHIVSKKSFTSWRDGDSGSIKWTGRVDELREKRLVLSGDRQKNTLLIALPELPDTPVLPDWKAPQ